MRRMRRRALCLAAALSLSTITAHANGRFPQANLLTVGPGDRNDVLVLRTTFGVVLSRDLGARWEWVCEEALDAVGTFDPSVALAADGAVTLGLPSGMRVSSADGCRWTSPAGALGAVVDLTQDAAGRALFAVGSFYDEAQPYTVVARSDDRGASWRRSARIDAFIVETVDVAPSDPQRVYLSGYRSGAMPTVMRSDDGGGSFRVMGASFPALASVWIAAVDPARPERLWFRVAAGFGTNLYRSDDGGGSAAMIAATTDPMDGFAVSDDGDTVWYGTANRAAGIFRSVRGGPFARVAATAAVRCMRFHDGTLFVCGDESVDGYSLAWSRDGGDTLHPMLSVRDIAGPLSTCGGDGGVTAVCGPVWSQLRPQLLDIDAAVAPPREPLPPRDAGVDVAVDGAAADAALDAPPDAPPVTDVALDVTALDRPAPQLDATLDSEAADRAAADVSLADASSSDATVLDAPRDVIAPAKDVVSPRDAGSGPAPKDCDCRAAPGSARSRGGLVALAIALALRPRWRRRARGR